ncbi:hypothetical protein [Vibrio rotiferianus]|uniref:hypothetical protein n=1 Tax=Vibrio rotiferianus TaxID=190895 RepID=UPI00148C4C72|nr:hypothetical protein [Vibrio rotiferianus]NOH68762.1 hypothetical protein [Vibrio rotiferianus]
MSSVDLGMPGGISSCGGAIIYTPVENGLSYPVNGSYILGAASSMGIDDSDVKKGDFVSIATDYTNRKKKITFTHPVIHDEDYYRDGIITISGTTTFWFDGMAWTNNFDSIHPAPDYGVFEISESGSFTLDQLEGIPFDTDLHVTVKVVGGGGVGTYYSQMAGQTPYKYFDGGSGGAGVVCEFVCLKTENAGAPASEIEVLLGAGATTKDTDGGSSSLFIEGALICSDICGGKGAANVESDTPLVEQAHMLSVEIITGAAGSRQKAGKGLSYDGLVHRGQPPHYENAGSKYYPQHNYGGGGGASVISDLDAGYGRGGRQSGGNNCYAQNGGCVIEIRPATQEEVAAQKEKNGL